MSGVALDELDLNAVEAALAMLDGGPLPALATRASCHVSPVTLKSVGDCFSCFDGEHDQGGATTCEDTTAATTDTSKPKRKRTRDPAADVLRRARRRQERQELRQQVERYEKQLQALAARGVTTKPKDPAEDPVAVDGDDRKVWEEVAREQRRQRQAGEEVNRQLKAKLAAHFDVSNRVGRLLTELASHHHKNAKDSSPNCGLLVRCCWGSVPPMVEDSISSRVPPHREQHVLQARELLREAYSTTDAVFASFMAVAGLSNGDELFNTSRIVRHESGPRIELLRSTPMPCGLQETREIVWNWLKWKRRTMLHGFNYSCVSRQVTDSGMEFQHHINFTGPFEAETFQGVSAMQKYEEADRIVLVFATKLVHAGGSIGFHDMGWILINRSPVDPLHKSVVRTCYRVMSDKDNCAETRTDALEFRSYVQRKLVQRMETRLKELSSELLRETGRLDLEALIDL